VIVPSAPLIPLKDPTLLFTNAGMNQFKDIFLGTVKPDALRVADTQKCIRVTGKHNDLEEVGHDTYHHTFFEMLGNWSFGDYYKREAIEWAWELVTDWWTLPKDRLYATVYHEDEEAERLWRRVTDIDHDHILKCGAKDNFWEMGETGPCGPCSELHIDLTPDRSGRDLVNAGDARVIEFWNLVFIQSERQPDGSLIPLPCRHVDTGMGLERIAAIMQGHGSDNYATDLFQPIIGAIEQLSGKAQEGDSLIPMRVIADHLRTLSFAVADGVLPSNEGRGYVLRRLVRRAVRYGRKLDLTEPFMFRLVPVLVDKMSDVFPELKTHAQHVQDVLRSEEESFSRTLDRGIDLFEQISGSVKTRGARMIPGAEVFKLYDTFGFPVDLTRLMAEEQGLSVDEDGFEEHMEQQRERARAARSAKHPASELKSLQPLIDEGMTSLFVGYDQMQAAARVVALIFGGELVNEIAEGQAGIVVLDRTPFYAEGGGQVGDTGWIDGADASVEVLDTRKVGSLFLHDARVAQGVLKNNSAVRARVEERRRRAAMRHHTATHLLQNALHAVVNERSRQAGSYVGPDRLRFDFTHGAALAEAELAEIERLVNSRIVQNKEVKTRNLPLEEVKSRKDIIAVFDEKYGETVRVVEVGDISRELCGGTHVSATGEIGYFRILGESSIAAGVRRIEAVCGMAAVEVAEHEHSILQKLSQNLSVAVDELPDRILAMQEQHRQLEKKLSAMQADQAADAAVKLAASKEDVNGIPVLVAHAPDMPGTALRTLMDEVRPLLGDGVAVLAAAADGKVSLICSCGKEAVARGLHAGNLVREMARQVGGGGGGKPTMAQAGGKDVESIPAALELGRKMILESLG
jgi:alanyl-tRNA synthetase